MQTPLHLTVFLARGALRNPLARITYRARWILVKTLSFSKITEQILFSL